MAGCIELNLSASGFGYAAAVIGVEPVMGIAQRVDVAHGAGHLALRNFQDLAELGHVHIAGLRRLDLGIPALRDQRRQPADFELQAHYYQQVCLLQFEEETGLRFDEVRILVALGDGIDRDQVASDFARQRGEVFGSSHHVDLGRGLRRDDGEQESGQGGVL